MCINELTWKNVFLSIIAIFLFSFLFLLLMYVIGRLFGYIDNRPEHPKPTNKKQAKQEDINNNNT